MSWRPRITPTRLLLLASLAAVGLFVAASALIYRVGFPLDDSWIHQTYARNLAENGEWAYRAGQPSGGSTSPLWTLLLTAGHLLSTQVPYSVTYMLGALALGSLALCGQQLAWSESAERAPGAWPWFGLFLVFEWHMVWAGASGMETGLMAALVLFVFWLVASQPGRPWLAGLAVGLSVWVRPDGITLLGPALWVIVVTNLPAADRARRAGLLVAGFAALFLPYLAFNQLLEGTWWPNTFYAKQAEYAALLETPLLSRILELAAAPLIGPGLLLLPGLLVSIFRGVKTRSPLISAGILWWLGYTLIYALRLPVTYQHARYLMPAMPVFFWLGWSGWRFALETIRLRPSLRFGLKATLAALTIAFLIMGANTFGQDVVFIESQMVDSARWIEQNIPRDELLAVHDIGAVGYFSSHAFIDLAGLVSPEVVSFIQEERQLAAYLDQREVDYLVVFPDWYKSLPAGKEMVYQSENGYEGQPWEENMAVYRWRP